jgi:nitroreductase
MAILYQLSGDEPYMDFFEVIERRRSIRKFKPDPISTTDLKKILEAARLAPSGSNRQPWYFIVIRDLETKRLISVAANNQTFIAEADTIIVALARLPHRQDPMIAVEHMVLAATALGYGACWIGAFDERKVKDILKVPESREVIALLPVGVPDETPFATQRKAFSEVFFKESYGTPLEL